MYHELFKDSNLIFVLATFVKCSEPDVILEEEMGANFVTDEITHTHIKETDPCPQTIIPKIEVYCGKLDFSDDCRADSVHVFDESQGLTINFINDQKGISIPQSGNSRDAFLQFTCVFAESFVHEYTFVLYQFGQEVSREKAKVIVTVQ